MHRRGGQKQVSARFWGVVFYVLCFVFVEAIIKNELLNEDFSDREREKSSGIAAVIYFRGMVKERNNWG